MHCGAFGDAISKVEKTDKRRKPVDPAKRRKAAREGRYYCKECKGTFTVTVGTVMEDSHVPIHKWLYAFREFLCVQERRLRPPAPPLDWRLATRRLGSWATASVKRCARAALLRPMMGGSSTKVVEADETFIGKKADVQEARGYAHKHAVLTLIDRTSGEARSFHIDDANAANIVPIVRKNVAKETTIATDEASHYNSLNKEYYHGTVNHSPRNGWSASSTPTAPKATSHTSSARCAAPTRTSPRSICTAIFAEFDFRYSNRVKLGVDDTKRTDRALRGIEGKRLTYRRTHGARRGPDDTRA